MKILHVVPSYLPATRYGGPIYAVHGLCKALVRRGVDVSVYTTNVNGNGVSNVETGVPVNLDGVKITYFSSPYFKRLYYTPDMKRNFKQKLGEYDLVHGHSIYLWPTMAAARACDENKVPYVVSPRGMLVKDLVKKKNKLIKYVWITTVEKRNFACADLIHFTSTIEREEARRFKLRMNRICVLPNGIDIDELETLATRCRTNRSKDIVPHILYLGRLHWKKGLDLLIRSMTHVRGADLVIAGNDEDGYASCLKNISREAGVDHRVRFEGPKYGADKYLALTDAYLSVLTSRSENFGNTVLESMAVGCPVVVSRHVGLAHTIQTSGAGMVVGSEPAEIASAINALINDPGRTKSMGERGMKTAREQFAWDVVVNKYIRQYRQVIQAARNADER